MRKSISSSSNHHHHHHSNSVRVAIICHVDIASTDLIFEFCFMCIVTFFGKKISCDLMTMQSYELYSDTSTSASRKSECKTHNSEKQQQQKQIESEEKILCTTHTYGMHSGIFGCVLFFFPKKKRSVLLEILVVDVQVETE